MEKFVTAGKEHSLLGNLSSIFTNVVNFNSKTGFNGISLVFVFQLVPGYNRIDYIVLLYGNSIVIQWNARKMVFVSKSFSAENSLQENAYKKLIK